HSTAGYMVGAGTTFKYVFDHRPGDVYWCTADCGWITGHSYVAYGPLFHGATQVLFEGVPTWPDAGRCWDVVDKYGVSLFYTAPTAIRSLMAAGDDPVTARSRASLRVLGSVGEPINPQAWRWYRDVVGGGRCAVVDTWWQTETGQHMIAPLPGATPAKPGSATLPFFGVEPALLDEQGREIRGEGQGYLVLKRSWPAAARTLAGDHARFEQTYFSAHKGYYFSGDGARRDADGYYWILGRVDDVINVSGHRIGTAEVESALVGHAFCCEAAVVPVEHAIKGQAIYAFVTLQQGHDYPPPPQVRAQLLAEVRRVIGPIATPEVLHWAPALPKTRSGKIMRRILRKIAAREEHEIGDVSTLADPGVVELLVKYRGV
ncbi:AMP-binding enzyme, partial [Helicosporidium sp. ATCC 50920]